MLTESALKPLDVLLVEDDTSHAALVHRHLMSVDGLNLVFASALGEGIATVRSQNVDVVLLDLGLPDCDPADTLMKALEFMSSVPIVVISSKEDMREAARSIRDGAMDYLFKSEISEARLRKAIDLAISRQKKSEQLHLAAEQRRKLLLADVKNPEEIVMAMNHEINNPLAIIYGLSKSSLSFIETHLDEFGLSKELREKIEGIQEAAERISHAVQVYSSYISSPVEDQVLPIANRLQSVMSYAGAESEIGLNSVLIVEDEPEVRDVLIDSLGSFGISNVQSCADGCEAWEVLNLRKFDLLITDLTMPAMSGSQLIGRIATLPPKDRPQIIIASATRIPEELERMLEQNPSLVSAILEKPYSDQALLALMQSISHRS